jgi:K+ potassium transporter
MSHWSAHPRTSSVRRFFQTDSCSRQLLPLARRETFPRHAAALEPFTHATAPDSSRCDKRRIGVRAAAGVRCCLLSLTAKPARKLLVCHGAGAASLIIWTLLSLALVKYALIVLQADDNGQGARLLLRHPAKPDLLEFCAVRINQRNPLEVRSAEATA